MIVNKTQKEIEDQLALATKYADNSKYPVMSYEEGVEAAFMWLLGDTLDKPINED